MYKLPLLSNSKFKPLFNNRLLPRMFKLQSKPLPSAVNKKLNKNLKESRKLRSANSHLLLTIEMMHTINTSTNTRAMSTAHPSNTRLFVVVVKYVKLLLIPVDTKLQAKATSLTT